MIHTMVPVHLFLQAYHMLSNLINNSITKFTKQILVLALSVPSKLLTNRRVPKKLALSQKFCVPNFKNKYNLTKANQYFHLNEHFDHFKSLFHYQI